jgi:UMF1 family MFS transporter
MGAAGAQARSMFTKLIPETRTTEFFGFFGFIGKAAAMIGPFLYALAVSQYDSRVAILTITIVILIGTYMTSRVDLEEGMRVAAEEDARIRGQLSAEE